MDQVEHSAFKMFKCASTDDFKRHVMETVKSIIDESPRITVNRLKAQMKRQYFVNAEDVDGALSALQNVYSCISSFQVPDREAIHLNPKHSGMWDSRNVQQLQTA